MKVEKIKLLVTGYKDFTGSHNPCQDIASVVNNKTFAKMYDASTKIEVEVIGTAIDVSWDKTWAELEQAVAKYDKIDAIISFGMAGGIDEIRLEQSAWNWNYGDFDAEGKPGKIGPIVEGGPDVLPSTLPYSYLKASIEHKIEKEGMDILNASYGDSDTGAYLCNYIAYQELYNYGSQIPFKGFIHITGVTEDSPLDKVVRSGVQMVESMKDFLIEKKLRHLDEIKYSHQNQPIS